jgi:tRNA(fMet)-specific endonuclease VapC
MKRYLLDSGIMGDFINHRRGVDERVREARRRGDRIGTGLPIVGELFMGIELSKTRERNMHRLLIALNGIICWPFDRVAAEEYGRIAAELRRIGRPMQQVDMQIAAIAMSLGKTTVVSSDSDLAAVPGLSVENWATE